LLCRSDLVEGFQGGNSFVLASRLGRRPTCYGDCVRRIAPKP